MRQRSSDPLAGPINKENEEQALQTLQAALDGMLGALLRLPLLAGGAAAAAAGSGDAAAGQQASPAAVGVASEEQQVEQQGSEEQPHDPLQPAAAQAQQQQQPEQSVCNENGFDADWHMSRHFCRVYLEGQVAILRRSLRECRDALAALQA